MGLTRFPEAKLRRPEYPDWSPQNKVNMTDFFLFRFIDPVSQKIVAKPLKYNGKVTRPSSVDILDIESEVGAKPSWVGRGLYASWDATKKVWVEIGDQDPTNYEDVTDDYYAAKGWREDAYRNREDFLPAGRPAVLDPQTLYVRQLEHLLALAHGKDVNSVRGFLPHINTSTGEGGQVGPQGNGPMAGSFTKSV